MRLLLFTILLLASMSVHAQRLTRQQTEEKLYEYLKEHSPNSYEMMQMLKDTPNKYSFGAMKITLSPEQSALTWVSERTEKGIIESINTVVHECMHGFTSRYPLVMLESADYQDYEAGDEYSAFYINKYEIYLVEHTPVFSSNRLKKHINKSLQTFRYNPYIAPKDNNLGSQIQGIYGLMDEWNAYYHGTKAAYDLFDYYKSRATQNKKVYLDHVRNLAGTYFAYYEFKYYILKYLWLAKSNYTEVYKGILNNNTLRQAYTAIDENFSGLISKFEERLDTIEDLVTSDNFTSVFREDGFYFIGNSGVGLFAKETELLKKELSKELFKSLHEELKIKHP